MCCSRSGRVLPRLALRCRCDDCGIIIKQHEPRYGETICTPWPRYGDYTIILQGDIWADRRFCRACWWEEFVHVHEYGLDGCLKREAMVRRVEIWGGLGRSGPGTIWGTIKCADGGVYRNEQTGLEIIMMQMVKMHTCYG